MRRRLTTLLAVGFWFPMLSLSAAGQDCVPGEMPIDQTQPASSSVKVQVFNPPNDEAVDAASVVGVEAEYHLAEFADGKYSVHFAFAALSSSVGVGGPENQHRPLPYPSGRIRVCLPLRELYEAGRVRWPLEVFAVLNRNLGKSETGLGDIHQEVARSNAVTLNSVNPAGDVQKNQAAGVTAAYRDAVTALNLTILRMQALGEVCPRFSDLEAQFDAAYQGWRSRNEALIDQLREQQLDLYERDMGRRVQANLVMKQVEVETAAQYRTLPESELRAHCEQHVRAFSNPRSDLETAGATQLAVIRSQPPAKRPAEK